MPALEKKRVLVQASPGLRAGRLGSRDREVGSRERCFSASARQHPTPAVTETARIPAEIRAPLLLHFLGMPKPASLTSLKEKRADKGEEEYESQRNNWFRAI